MEQKCLVQRWHGQWWSAEESPFFLIICWNASPHFIRDTHILLLTVSYPGLFVVQGPSVLLVELPWQAGKRKRGCLSMCGNTAFNNAFPSAENHLWFIGWAQSSHIYANPYTKVWEVELVTSNKPWRHLGSPGWSWGRRSAQFSPCSAVCGLDDTGKSLPPLWALEPSTVNGGLPQPPKVAARIKVCEGTLSMIRHHVNVIYY